MNDIDRDERIRSYALRIQLDVSLVCEPQLISDGLILASDKVVS